MPDNTSNTSLSTEELSFTIPTIPFEPHRLYTFQDKSLERRIFTHTSAGIQQNNWNSFSPSTREHRDDNEHLEWLGDSILKGLTAHLLDVHFPEMDEGRMSVRIPVPCLETSNDVRS
jgi:dsRNA-specific ribonuclease